MKNQRGFGALPILIAILLGVVILGGGAYFVVQLKSASQATSENSDATIPTYTQVSSETKTQNNANIQTVQKNNIAISAKLDSNPLKTASANPTISGTATGVSKVIVLLADKGEVFWTSDPVSVLNGRWSVVGSIPQIALSGETSQFYILVNASTNSQGTLPSLTTGTLIVKNGKSNQDSAQGTGSYKTYTNAKYKFSILYPNTWAIGGEDGNGIEFDVGDKFNVSDLENLWAEIKVYGGPYQSEYDSFLFEKNSYLTTQDIKLKNGDIAKITQGRKPISGTTSFQRILSVVLIKNGFFYVFASATSERFYALHSESIMSAALSLTATQ